MGSSVTALWPSILGSIRCAAIRNSSNSWERLRLCIRKHSPCSTQKEARRFWAWCKRLPNIGQKESFGKAGNLRDRLGRQVTAANRAFHGCRPARSRPITRQEKVRKLRRARRPFFFEPGPGGECSANFLDNVCFLDLRLAHPGNKFGQLADRQRNHV